MDSIESYEYACECGQDAEASPLASGTLAISCPACGEYVVDLEAEGVREVFV